MVPRLRSGSFSTELFARYQRSEQALLLAMVEMVVNRVSTRKVKAVVEELCGTEFSKSTVSTLCKGLDDIVKEWNERELSSQEYPFLLVDALVIRVRNGGRVRLLSVLIAIGINRDGYREILGFVVRRQRIGGHLVGVLRPAQGARAQRGRLGLSDDHKGLVNAIETHFQGATWQRCQTHFIRNILDACPKALQGELHGRLRLIFDAPDLETARRLLNETIDAFGARAPKAVARLEAGFEDAMAVMALPKRYRKRLRTTNGVERLNQKIRRRERVIRIFPNEESAIRLIGAVLVEIDEAWTTGHRYFNMAEYWEWKANTEKQREEVNNADTCVSAA